MLVAAVLASGAADAEGLAAPHEAAQQGASAAARSVVLLPTLTPAGDAPSPKPLRRPDVADSPVAERAREVDLELREAVQDLGLTLDLADVSFGALASPRDTDLLERAGAGPSWVISPRIEVDGAAFVVRIVGGAPAVKTLVVRAEHVAPAELRTRAVVMLRDVVRALESQASCASCAKAAEAAPARPVEKLAAPARSAGRPTLALNAALFGGAVGYSIQRSSNSDDPRLLYPLMAIGTGVGLGGAMIVAEEWDVGVGDAWYLSAGAWWPGAAGMLVAKGRGVEPAADRYPYALLGAGAGLGLATFSLSQGGMGEGGAALAHSGGALGLFFGATTELAIVGSADAEAYRGMGYGAGAGVLVAGALATQVSVDASRVLLVDLGVGLGALAGAATTSPLLFGDRTEGRDRAFLLATSGGAIAGGTVAWIATRKSSASAKLPPIGLPYAGVIGSSQTSTGGAVPAYGVGMTGTF